MIGKHNYEKLLVVRITSSDKTNFCGFWVFGLFLFDRIDQTYLLAISSKAVVPKILGTTALLLIFWGFYFLICD